MTSQNPERGQNKMPRRIGRTRITDLLRSSHKDIDWDAYIVPEDSMKKFNSKVREFYRNQNEQIEKYKVVDRVLDGPMPTKFLESYSCYNSCYGRQCECDEGANDLESQPLLGSDGRSYSSAEADKSRAVRAAIIVNFLSNVILLVAKATVALLSTSISLWASVLESGLDFLSTVIVYYATSWSERTDWMVKFNYPVTKSRKRFEPLGVTVFGVLMVTSFLQIALEAISRLYQGIQGDHHIVNLTLSGILTMIMTVVIKFGCWLYCRTIKNSTSVKALQADAMNDVVFNIITLLFPLAGSIFLFWFLDPLGALLISMYISYEWTEHCANHIKRLSGASADLSTHRQFVYMASRFSDLILNVKSVQAYHAGDSLICEIDIVVDEKISLRDGHDMAESLQLAIESLEEPSVERAFVHLDYRKDNPAGHH